jgi:hypothetical protein
MIDWIFGYSATLFEVNRIYDVEWNSNIKNGEKTRFCKEVIVP